MALPGPWGRGQRTGTSMSITAERLRADLVVSEQEARDGPVTVIKDPATGRFFRMAEVEYFIARHLDGETPLEAIRQRTEKKFGASLDNEMLGGFVAALRRSGLLESPEAAPAGGHGHAPRIRGNVLYLRLKAIDPDRWFDRWVHKVDFFFSRWFLLQSASLIVLATIVTITSSEEIGQELRHLFRFQAILLAWVVVLTVTCMHELAHGLTCKHFGGRVHEMGFMLLYFQPAMYCNVSDAWLFPEKSKRLWVTFAGAYFEIFVWSCATLLWRLVDPDTWLSYAALVVMATSAIKSFFNLNPLIKLDGYYLLSDLLGIPNLRARAMTYLYGAVPRLWGGGSPPDASVGPRERRIYLVYGVLAASYSYFVLSYLVMRFGGFLTGRYQGPGFLVFTGLLLFAFRAPVARAATRAHVPEIGRRWNLSPLRRGLRYLALPALAALLFLVRMDLKVPGDFEVTPRQNMDIRAQVEGFIEEVRVEEGDRVQAGELIARISDRDFQAGLRRVQAESEEKEAHLRLLRAGPRQEEIAAAQATAEKSQERLRYADSQLERMTTLQANQLVSQAQKEEAEEQVATRRGDLEEARSALAALLSGSRPEEIQEVEAEIARLAADRRYLEDQLALTRVVAPHAGIVTTPRMQEKVGEYLGRGDPIVQIHSLNAVTVEIAISEKEIGEIRVGQRVKLRPRAFPQRSLSGAVVAIAPVVSKSEGRASRVVKVTTEVDNSELLLKSAMTGHAKIYCGERRLAELLTRRLTGYLRVEFWSWW
jgi:putative peptide zinc metalloprotease protein